MSCKDEYHPSDEVKLQSGGWTDFGQLMWIDMPLYTKAVIYNMEWMTKRHRVLCRLWQVVLANALMDFTEEHFCFIHSSPLKLPLPEGARKCLLSSMSRCGSSCSNGRRRSLRRGCWGRSPTWALGALPSCCLLQLLLPIHCRVGQSHTTPQPLVTFLLKTGKPLSCLKGVTCIQFSTYHSLMLNCWLQTHFLHPSIIWLAHFFGAHISMFCSVKWSIKRATLVASYLNAVF